MYHAATWFDSELSDCQFKDERIKKRFRILIENLWNGIGKPIPLACQDWANTKAAYRFLANDAVSENEIMKGHFSTTQQRVKMAKGPILVLQDTTEFSYQRENKKPIGITKSINGGKNILGKTRFHTVCGILMHTSLAITTDGLPLGIPAIKFWTRDKFKGTNALKKKINPTRMPIDKKESIKWLENLQHSTSLLKEPERCIHIGDRESDIYELYCKAKEMKTHFLVRTCVDRLAGDGLHTIKDEMEYIKVKGIHKLNIVAKNKKPQKVSLEIKYKRINVLPPVGKQKLYPGITLTVIHAEERNSPKNREKISWKLITDLPVKTKAQAIEKLTWYSMRWKIETFHKILKSGCRAEDSKLKTAQRLTNLISIFCIISWRIFWMTILNRSHPLTKPTIVFTENELDILECYSKDKFNGKKLSDFILRLAKLGGYLARNSDPPPGNMVLWRGLNRLIDMQLGYTMAIKNCG